jgi:glycine cleavage system H protein
MTKKIEEIVLRYTAEHEWARLEGDQVRVGLTDYAQSQLGDVVFAELPAAGSHFSQGEVFARVESVKAVSECYMPLSGEIAAANEALNDDPALFNTSPYEGGWMVLVKPDDPAAFGQLLTAEAYRARLKGGA